MSRYIDADRLWNCRPLPPKNKYKDERYMAGFNECMRGFAENIDKQIDIESDDLIPKSNVERLQVEVERLKAEIAQYQLDLHYSLCREDETAGKTARQIFAEIYEDCFDQFGYIDYDALAKLNKKYTEAATNERAD